MCSDLREVLNIQREDLNARLMHVCHEGGTGEARFLLERGADVHLRRGRDGGLWKGGKYAFSGVPRAARYGHLGLVSTLLDAGGGNLEEALFQAASRPYSTSMVALLLERGADIHYQGDLALFHAAQSGRYSTTRLLLSRGARVHACSIAVAERHRHYGVAMLLRRASKTASY